mgnify:CR=1 FL=1
MTEEECPSCKATESMRNRIVSLGLAGGTCAMLDDEQERSMCNDLTSEFTDADLNDPEKIAGFFATMIKKGGVEPFRRFFNLLNEQQATFFIKAVDMLESQGETIAPDVRITYNDYLHRMQGGSIGN